MAFHTLPFLLIFLPLVVVGYRLIGLRPARLGSNLFLLAGSIAFCALNNPLSLPPIFLSLIANHLIGRGVAGSDDKRSRRWLVAGIFLNVTFLCWFKFPGLFPSVIGPAHILGATGLPLGVSFFTIQQIMYLMDIRERLAAPATLFDHAQAMLYFPCISAGPIIHPRDLLRELHSDEKRNWSEDILRGAVRFAIGLFKKTVIADNLGVVVSAGYAAKGDLGIVEALAICSFFTLQVYFDFSGYSDMAIGVGRMLGHTVPENFNNPLRANSISDFWQRWHMTLTTFITTYLFTPLVRLGGKVTTSKAMAAIVIAMALAGVWHGSGLGFLIFGLFHGVGLAVRLAWKASKRRLPDGLGTLVTFLFVAIAFIFFRAPDLGTAWTVLSSLFGAHGLINPSSLPDNPVIIALGSDSGIPALCCVIAFGLAFLGPTSTQVAWTSRLTPRLAFGIVPLVAISLLFINARPSKGFIYGDRPHGVGTRLSSSAGFGNEDSPGTERVVVGRDGWLYFSPSLAYTFGEPFLNPTVLKLHAKQMTEMEGDPDPNPDPRPALFGLIEDCRRWGIRLVVVPVPTKAMLQPFQLPSREGEESAVPDNPSFRQFANELQEEGAEVFDWRPHAVQRDEVRFLKRDTHWTPTFMEEYGARLASRISSLGAPPGVSATKRYRLLAERHSNRGDLAALLRVLPGPAQFPLETVETHAVVDAATGVPAAPDQTAGVLLLGDSFTNIYSLPTLGWGEHAGLAEHLAYGLNQPIDVLAVNGAGATEIRRELVRAAKGGRLSGKKVLIYEFAISDLAVENWKVLRLPAPPSPQEISESRPAVSSSVGAPADSRQSASRSSVPVVADSKLVATNITRPSVPPPPSQNRANGGLEVVADLTFVSKSPEPGVSPYRDCIGITKVTVTSVERGDLANRSILVAYWLMRDDVLTDAAKYKSGDKLRMTLIPFEQADTVARSTQRSDDTRDYDSPLFWATRVELAPK